MFADLRALFICILIVLFLLLSILVAQNGQTPAVTIYLDPSQLLNLRVDDLISRMTLEQKASQMRIEAIRSSLPGTCSRRKDNRRVALTSGFRRDIQSCHFGLQGKFNNKS
jgi:hypothetical protein